MANPWFLTFHLIGMVIYVGGLLNISRLLGYHVKEEEGVRVRLSRMETRMYFLVNLPGLAIMLTFGLLMLFGFGRADGKGEGILNYIRPNEQVLVLERDLQDGALVENANVYQRAIEADSFAEKALDNGHFEYSFEARTRDANGDTVLSGMTLTLPGKGTLHKQRTPWGAVFHAKLIGFVILLILDLMVMRQILALARDPSKVPKATRFKILHGLIALVMIAMIVLVKTRVGLGGS